MHGAHGGLVAWRGPGRVAVSALTGTGVCGTLRFSRPTIPMPNSRPAPVTAHPRQRWGTAGALLLGLLALSGPGAASAVEPAASPESALADACVVLTALDFDAAVGARVTLSAALAPAAGELPERCRISATVAPGIGIEAWLPVDDWNGKLLVTGCQGQCGSILAEPMEDASARGYATATTDGGHGAGKSPDGRWAFNNTALEEDFGHRAVHVTARLAAALAEAFYGSQPAHAYFQGCGTGGRQALVAASRDPDDFDGIIAGAPFDPRLSVPLMIWADAANTGPDGKPILKRPQFDLLHKGALAACDAADGQVDGVIGDPPACTFQPDSLACTEAHAQGCLDGAQLEAARRIYSGPVTRAGRRLAPFGAAVGSEAGWERELIGRDGRRSRFFAAGQDWLHYHAFEPDPPEAAGPLTFDFDRDPPRLAAAAARTGYGSDLERFAAREGRLIIYHGWADARLMPGPTLAYWQQALHDNGGAAQLARFARLFLLPGVEHCGGGQGAGDVDYLTALERWVEQDEAPDQLIATRPADSAPAGTHSRRTPATGEVSMRRPVFPYPEVARYSGKGDPLDPASYERIAPGPAPASR